MRSACIFQIYTMFLHTYVLKFQVNFYVIEACLTALGDSSENWKNHSIGLDLTEMFWPEAKHRAAHKVKISVRVPL